MARTKLMHEKPEFELLVDSRNGDKDAMAELFRRHYPSSIRVARKMLRSQDEFLDAVQSAYLAAFRNIGSFRGEASFKSWITQIVKNQCLMRLREPARHCRYVSLDDPGAGGVPTLVVDRAPSPEDLARVAEISEVLTEVAARLPKTLREAFTLFTISGLSILETAKALGLTKQATKTRIFRARSLMRSELTAVWMNERTPRTARQRKLRGQAAAGPVHHHGEDSERFELRKYC